jgi:hypothetical protein
MKYHNHIPFIESGLEVSRISFSGGRVAASMANHGGLTHLDYYGAQRIGDARLFTGDDLSAWNLLFRSCVRIDGRLYYLEFNNTSIFPFGYESECELEDVRLRHSMSLLNDALVYTVEVLNNPKDRTCAMEVVHGHHTLAAKPTRQWNGFETAVDKDFVYAGIMDRQQDAECGKNQSLTQWGANADSTYGETLLGVVATSDLTMSQTPPEFLKYYFRAAPVQAKASVCLVFGHHGKTTLQKRARQLRQSMFDEVAKLRKAHEKRMISQPRIAMENSVVESALSTVIPVIDSLKVKDIPGAIRAADSGYWVWGWDSMVHADAYCLANDSHTIDEMLDFYRETADPEHGIFHSLTTEGKTGAVMAFPAQCLYAVMLYHAWVFSGKRDILAEYFPFALKIVNRAGANEVNDSGLISGVALYPDFPEDLEQNGKDISVFNNGIYYQALRCMTELADELGENKTRDNLKERSNRLRDNFPRFFDEEKGYFVDSLSAENFSQRKHYPSYAILWVTPFATGLVAPWRDRIAAFMKDNLAMRRGVRMLPTWDSRYMYDGNQLGMTMPVVENAYRELRRSVQDDESAAQLLANIEWFWSQLCIPEALTCEFENHGITPDNPGRKQAFCGKAWLSMFYHVIAGINFDAKGLTICRGSGIELCIEGLTVRDKSLDISIKGQGPKLTAVTLNGESVPAPYHISFAALQQHNYIEILNEEEPSHA